MTKAETIAAIESCSEQIRALGATGLYLYGSASRDELTAESDVDLFVDYDPAGPFSFVELIHLQDLVNARLNRDVDLTTRNGLHPLLKEEIERSSVRIF
jgi:predicted nucleotidyltransferase